MKDDRINFRVFYKNEFYIILLYCVINYIIAQVRIDSSK